MKLLQPVVYIMVFGALRVHAQSHVIVPQVNLSQIGGAAVSTGPGHSDIGTPRVILASDSPTGGGASSGGTPVYSTSPLNVAFTSGTTPANPLWVLWVGSAPVAVIDSTVSLNGITLLATNALQTIGNASLASIDGKITAINTGAIVFNGAQPVSQSGVWSFNIDGTTFSAVNPGYVVWTGTPTVKVVGSTVSLNSQELLATNALQTTGNASLSSIDGKLPALGQALAAGSVPTVLTALQLSALTPPAAITNFATESGGNLATIAGKDFAKESGGNLATLVAKDFATSAKQDSAQTSLTTIAARETLASPAYVQYASTPAVTVSSANLAYINGGAIPPTADGRNSLPTQDQSVNDLLVQIILQLQNIGTRLWMMDAKMGMALPTQ